MSPWIQVYANLPAHRKTCRLRDALGLKNNYEAVGLLVCLWTWMAVNAPSGSLAGFGTRDIAEAAGWRKSPGKFQDALIEAGFLDLTDDGSLLVHDWDEHAGLLQDILEEQKRKTRDRVRKHREKKKRQQGQEEKPPSGNEGGNVTSNGCNAPTKPNLTKPIPNLYVDVVVDDTDTGVTDGTTAAAGDSDVGFLCGGLLGDAAQGVVLLSDEQAADLAYRMGDDVCLYYVRKLADFILRNKAQVRNHYETILRWWKEDGEIKT